MKILLITLTIFGLAFKQSGKMQGTKETIEKLVKSMAKCVKFVIQNNGLWTEH